jgi:hypothetical protein
MTWFQAQRPHPPRGTGSADCWLPAARRLGLFAIRAALTGEVAESTFRGQRGLCRPRLRGVVTSGQGGPRHCGRPG